MVKLRIIIEPDPQSWNYMLNFPCNEFEPADLFGTIDINIDKHRLADFQGTEEFLDEKGVIPGTEILLTLEDLIMEGLKAIKQQQGTMIIYIQRFDGNLTLKLKKDTILLTLNIEERKPLGIIKKQVLKSIVLSKKEFANVMLETLKPLIERMQHDCEKWLQEDGFWKYLKNSAEELESYVNKN